MHRNKPPALCGQEVFYLIYIYVILFYEIVAPKGLLMSTAKTNKAAPKELLMSSAKTNKGALILNDCSIRLLMRLFEF